MLSQPEDVRPNEEQTPTTPRPGATFVEHTTNEATNEESTPSTPTRHTFGGLPGQRPLPDEPITPAQAQETPIESQDLIKRDASHRSTTSQQTGEVQDVEMGDGDDDNAVDDDGSDNDSVTSDSQRPSKKKKGQRFFCTDFPPCQLSFTRSEHLARHIRYI